MSVSSLADPAVQIDLKLKTQTTSITKKIEQMTKVLENLEKQISEVQIEIFIYKLQGEVLHDVLEFKIRPGERQSTTPSYKLSF